VLLNLKALLNRQGLYFLERERIAMTTIALKTHSRTELVDITGDIQAMIREAGVREGVCMVYIPHTTAAVTINENADPTVKGDILKVINKIIPWDDGYRHLEGNSAAHIKSTLVGASELVAVVGGKLQLGTWQGIFFCEFDGPRRRKVHIHFV
jgi:secondary thiamine-phosphate synthase enzyme